MSKLTNEERLEKVIRTKTFLNQELTQSEQIFKEVFINSFLSKSIQSGKSKIDIPSNWNIKYIDLLTEMNSKLSSYKNYLDSRDLLIDLFKAKSLRSPNDDTKYAWLSEKVTEAFKNVIFNGVEDNIITLWKSNKIQFYLNISKREVVMTQNSKTYVKSFNIRDLDLYPSQRGML